MRIALAQINTTIGDFSGNGQKIFDFIAKARMKNCQMVIFPELALCGYPPTDFLYLKEFMQAQDALLQKIAAQGKDLTVIVGYAEGNSKHSGKPFYNTAAVIAQGKIASKHFKVLIPTYDVFDEARYFEEGPAVSLAQGSDPKFSPFAVTLCEDIWKQEGFVEANLYDRNPLEEAVTAGAKWLVNISASPFHLGKKELRTRLLQAIAKRYKRPIAYVNLVGGNDALLFDGGSMVVDAAGVVCAQSPQFVEDLLVVDLSGEKIQSQGVTPPKNSEMAELRKSLVMGLHDYAQKCRFKSAILGLSGGIDSAVVAKLAAEALGPENVWGFALPSRYSSKASLEDAKILAKNLGIHFEVLSIEEPFTTFLKDLKPFFRDLPSDHTEENLQARIRGVLLMALSNKFGHLLLSTGNKSELAVGYCTLYGDMNGGLAVLGDVPKTLVYALAKHINGDQEIIPLSTLKKPPSAELRPEQTDQDTLPDYEILDRILQAYIEQGKDPKTIVQEFSDPRFSQNLVDKIVSMVNAAEYKRRQAAPVLRVTTKSFGAGRRLPIAHRFAVGKEKS